MRRILLTGRNGQVGWELERTLAPLGNVIALDRTGMNLGDPDAIRGAIRQAQPNLLVNAAAYTAVDQAEDEPEIAMRVNGVAPGVMAEEARRLNALLVHFSTDYVFDGAKGTPYIEEDHPNPLSTYGRTKLHGEQAIVEADCAYVILRTSWVYGTRGKNFLRTILRLASEREELRVVSDQFGTPTWSRFIAEATAQLAARLTPDGVRKTYHLVNDGIASWHEFATAIVDLARESRKLRAERVVPIRTDEYPTKAIRPRYSVMSTDKLRGFGMAFPPWRESLRLCLEETVAVRI